MNKFGEENSSSDDESEGDETDDKAGNFRGKRDAGGFAWCGVETETRRKEKLDISWPPNPSQVNNYKWRNLRPVGNLFFGNKMQLYSKTGYNLAVYPDGTVRGTKDDNDVHTHLQLSNAGHTGHVRIKGMLSNLFVAMDNKGRLYGEVHSQIEKDDSSSSNGHSFQPEMSELAAVFIEAFQGSYMTYASLKYAHLGWYLGIKKSGRFKRGPKTAYGQKAIMFLQRRSKFQ